MDLKQMYWYFEGKSTETEIEELKRWVEESEENAKEFHNQQILHDLITINADVPSAQQVGNRKRRRGWYVAASVIFICILMSLAGIFYTDILGSDNYYTISVPNGQRVNVSLPDGSDVWLNAGAILTYPQKFNYRSRTVHLEGEGFFNVSKSASKSFVVKTYYGDVNVMGTTFNIDSNEEDGRFETALFEGSVIVHCNLDGTDYELVPGQKLTFENQGLVISKIQNTNSYRWREGLICFTDIDFLSVLESLRKYYDVKFVVESDSYDNELLTGKFRINDGLDYTLRVLQKSLGFNYSIEEDYVYIK